MKLFWFVTGLVFLVVVKSASAAPPKCMRWQNSLSHCDVFGGAHCSSSITLSEAQRYEYQQRLYSKTPLDACKKFFKDAWGYTGPVDARKVYDDYYDCRWDSNNDGQIDDNQNATAFYTDIPLNDCCYARIKGPYADVPVEPSFPTSYPKHGERFSEEVRVAVRDANSTSNESMWSNAVGRGFGTTPGVNRDYFHELVWEQFMFDGEDQYVSMRTPLEPDSAEIDHLIPRVDSNGCACGNNSISNAQVLSRQYNRELSNSCTDPRRKQILQRWAVQ